MPQFDIYLDVGVSVEAPDEEAALKIARQDLSERARYDGKDSFIIEQLFEDEEDADV